MPVLPSQVIGVLIYFSGFTIAFGLEMSPCGQLPPGSLPSEDKDQKLFPPWSATIKKEYDGIRPERTIAGVIVAPKIIMSSAFYFVLINTTEMVIPPVRFFEATVGEHQWNLDGNDSEKIGISHLTLHPRYSMGNFWSNTRNDQILFHLTEPINISETVQPICLPSGKMIDEIVQPDGSKNPLLLTGWSHGFPDEIFLDLIIQSRQDCQKMWKDFGIEDVYENRYCATPSPGNYQTKCIHRDVSTLRQFRDSYYLGGQMNQLFSHNYTCTPEAVYFFNQYEEYTYSWLNNVIRCDADDSYACGSGKCIPLFRLCNRFVDCEDGEDEVLNFCKFLYKCPEGEFYCGADGDDSCIPDYKVNDGVKDCPNGEDEWEHPIRPSQMVVGGILVVATLIVVGFILAVEYRKYRNRNYDTLSSESDDEIDTDIITNTYHGSQITAPWRSMRNLICIKRIGGGGSGEVYRAVDLTDVQNPTGFAIKCVNIYQTLKQNIQPGPSSVTSEESIRHALKNVLNETEILNDLHSDHVVGYFGCWAEDEGPGRTILNKSRLLKYIQKLIEDSSVTSSTRFPWSHIFIRMEYCDFTLTKYLADSNAGKESQDIIQIAKDITSGLKYIHSKGYIHRDLKPGNIFCKKGPENSYTWKIGDFGLAIHSRENAQEREVNKKAIGTKLYQSPELISGMPYSEKSDLFSLGLVFVEIVQQPEFNRAGSFDQIRERMDDGPGRFQYILDNITMGKYEDFVRVINLLLSGEPNLRPSAEGLLLLLQDL